MSCLCSGHETPATRQETKSTCTSTEHAFFFLDFCCVDCEVPALWPSAGVVVGLPANHKVPSSRPALGAGSVYCASKCGDACVNHLRRLRTVAQRSVKRAPPKSVFCREIQKISRSMRKQAVVQKEVF